MKRVAAVLFVLALAAGAALAAEPLFEMSFSADKNEITIGDELTLTIEVRHGKEMQLLALPSNLEVPHFEVKRIEQIPPRGDKGAVALRGASRRFL